MPDPTPARPELPETFSIDACESAFVKQFCPYKGNPDPLVVWRAAWEACRAQARSELIAERDAVFNRGMFVAAGIVVTAHDMPTVAEEIIRSVGPAAVKDVDEYDAGVLAPHFPQFAPYARKD